MEASAIQILVQTEKHVVIHNAWIYKQTPPIAVVVMQPLVLMVKLAKMEFVKDVRLYVPLANHAAKVERHAARFAVQTHVVLLANHVLMACAPHASLPVLRDKPAAEDHVVMLE